MAEAMLLRKGKGDMLHVCLSNLAGLDHLRHQDLLKGFDFQTNLMHVALFM